MVIKKKEGQSAGEGGQLFLIERILGSCPHVFSKQRAICKNSNVPKHNTEREITLKT